MDDWVIVEPVEKQEASFDKKHYPEGLNHNFTSKGKNELIQEYDAKFTSPEKRDIARNFHAVKQALFCVNMNGKVVVDLGAGTGMFAKVLTERAGSEGQVILTEISAGFVEHMEQTYGDLPNVKVLKSFEDSIPIKEKGQVDVVFVCDVYHHFTYPKVMLSEIQRILSPGGKMIFIDFYRNDDRIWSHPKGWVLEHVRAGKATFCREVREAGFVLDQEVYVPGLEENYFLVWRKSRTAMF